MANEHKTWTRDQLQGLGLSPHDAAFLVEQGLPLGTHGYLTVNGDFDDAGGPVLAYDGDVPLICRADGRVVSAENAIVDVAIADLRAIDADAWAAEINYWPIVAAQMREGNL